jgi:hypothetical protein
MLGESGLGMSKRDWIDDRKNNILQHSFFNDDQKLSRP